MAVKGRTPKPTALRKLEGNPGKRPINRREPEPTGPLRAPDFVTGAASEEWDRVVSSMPPGVYTAADVPVLTVYCLAWVQYRNALALVAREGMTSVGSTKQTCAHPAIAIAAKQADLILRASDRLGMSPTARARLEVQAAEQPESKFGDMLGRPNLHLVK